MTSVRRGELVAVVSTNSNSNSEEQEYWTTNYIIEELKYELGIFTDYIKNEDGEFVEGRKYYDLAKYLQYRISVYRPVPFFRISLSDLSEKLKQELSSLHRETLVYVLKEAVARIFEDIDARQYHTNSISSLLEVQLID